MKHLAALSAILLSTTVSVSADPQLTRVWGLYGYGDNWRGSSAGIDEIAAQARTIPGVEFVHVHNYWDTQSVYDAIVASPPETKIVIYGYSCGANAMTVIAHGFDSGSRKIDVLAGIQESLWCGGNDLGPAVIFGQMTVGDCRKTAGLGCKMLAPADGFTGQILNIERPDLRHMEADNDVDAQNDVLNAIMETANPPMPIEPPVEGGTPPETGEHPPDWEHYGHGHALARQGLATMLRGAALFKRGVHHIVCYHEGC